METLVSPKQIALQVAEMFEANDNRTIGEYRYNGETTQYCLAGGIAFQQLSPEEFENAVDGTDGPLSRVLQADISVHQFVLEFFDFLMANDLSFNLNQRHTRETWLDKYWAIVNWNDDENDTSVIVHKLKEFAAS